VIAEPRFACVRVAGLLYGIAVEHVCEVQRDATLTRVPLAAPVVSGLMNLRGRIVTVVELRRCLGIARRPDGQPPVNLIVGPADNPFGLLVDEVGDVVSVAADGFAPVPGRAGGPGREMLAGVYRLDAELLRVLDIDRVRACAAA
jgi:purine-binding chemotaxis protein CheW